MLSIEEILRTAKQAGASYVHLTVGIPRKMRVNGNLITMDYPKLLPVAMRFGFYQRLDYLLHIPIGQMTKDNVFYQKVVLYLRKNIAKVITNSYLTGKNKMYLFLLSLAPKGTRCLHAKIRRLQKNKENHSNSCVRRQPML